MDAPGPLGMFDRLAAIWTGYAVGLSLGFDVLLIAHSHSFLNEHNADDRSNDFLLVTLQYNLNFFHICHSFPVLAAGIV